MAAYRAGIKTVLIPADNEPDLYEVDKTVKEHVEFIPVERVEQVLEKALVRRPVSVSAKDSAMPAPVSESVESSATSGLQQ